MHKVLCINGCWHSAAKWDLSCLIQNQWNVAMLHSCWQHDAWNMQNNNLLSICKTLIYMHIVLYNTCTNTQKPWEFNLHATKTEMSSVFVQHHIITQQNPPQTSNIIITMNSNRTQYHRSHHLMKEPVIHFTGKNFTPSFQHRHNIEQARTPITMNKSLIWPNVINFVI